VAQEKLDIEQFLGALDGEHPAFIRELHDYLTENGCKVRVEEKKSGFFASYRHVKSKKSIVNFLSRKKGPRVRIYGENAGKYPDLIKALPEEMIRSMREATVCKRLIDPEACSPKCSLGYDFTIGSERFQKCRYGGFEFQVSKENNPYIKSFVENETKERA